MSPPPGVAATRRTALAGALGGALALSGCDAEPPAAEPSPTPSPTSSPTSSPTPDDPDADLVDQVVAELQGVLDLVESALMSRPVLRPAVAPFRALHVAHLRVLTDEGYDVFATSLSGSRSDVLRQVRVREAQAQRRLADWSMAADSGPLARLLASMSAAIAQQLAAPTRGTR